MDLIHFLPLLTYFKEVLTGICRRSSIMYRWNGKEELTASIVAGDWTPCLSNLSFSRFIIAFKTFRLFDELMTKTACAKAAAGAPNLPFIACFRQRGVFLENVNQKSSITATVAATGIGPKKNLAKLTNNSLRIAVRETVCKNLLLRTS